MSNSTCSQREFWLYNVLPRQYDGDSADVDAILSEFGPVTAGNIDEAIQVCVRNFERDLWQDNLGKQLLGRLADDDLEGE